MKPEREEFLTVFAAAVERAAIEAEQEMRRHDAEQVDLKLRQRNEASDRRLRNRNVTAALLAWADGRGPKPEVGG